jgi:hypothetical protein
MSLFKELRNILVHMIYRQYACRVEGLGVATNLSGNVCVRWDRCSAEKIQNLFAPMSHEELAMIVDWERCETLCLQA